MDWNRLEGDWKQMKGKVKEKWGKLTDDDLTAINGRREQLEGKLQERYGYAKNQARREIEDWYRSTKSHLADEIETLRTEIQSLDFDRGPHRQQADRSRASQGGRSCP